MPLYYSEDLIHWELVNYVLRRESRIDLRDAPPSGGIWAPTIRCHEGPHIYHIGLRIAQKYFDCVISVRMEFCSVQNGEDFIYLEKRAEDFFQTVCRIPVEREKELYLTIEAHRLSYGVYWGYQEGERREAGHASTRFLSCEVAGSRF